MIEYYHRVHYLEYICSGHVWNFIIVLDYPQWTHLEYHHYVEVSGPAVDVLKKRSKCDSVSLEV